MNTPAITNMVLSLGAMQGGFLDSTTPRPSFPFVPLANPCHIVARKFPDTPEFVNYLRIGYVSAQVISLALYFFITLKVGRIHFTFVHLVFR